MDKKIISIFTVAILVLAGVGIYFALDKKTDEPIYMLSRVNTEGSGLYLDKGEVAADYLEVVLAESFKESDWAATDKFLKNDIYVVVFHPEKWGAKIFGTPGTSSIQHMQMKEIVENVLGLKFQIYRATGGALSTDTVYYDSGITNYSLFKDSVNDLTGAYIWQPHYDLAVSNGCVGLIMTNVLFPDHTCCIVAGTGSILKNEEVSVAFLAAYIKSVDKLNEVLEAGSGEEYDKLVKFTASKVGLTDKDTPNPDKVIKDALNSIKYVYSDDKGDNPLAALKKDVATLTDSYIKAGVTKDTLKDMGFSNSTEFADRFVDDSFIKKAFGYTHTGTGTKTITVAVIGGDIHQIALHYGVELGYFEEYGLNVKTSTQSNGNEVAIALQNGGADFGFLGAPPLTIKTINGQLIKSAEA